MTKPNPSNPPPKPELPSNQNFNPKNTTTTTMTDPSTLPPPSPSMSTAQENHGLNHNLQLNQSHHTITMNNNDSSPSEPQTPTTSLAPPHHQYHDSFPSTFFEQFLSHIVRHSTPTPPLQQSNPSSASFNFKVEPIQLLINSSVPLLNHDQVNQLFNDVVTPPRGPPPPPPPPQPAAAGGGGEGGKYRKHQKALKHAGSLANLLPTGTVLAFQELTPSLSATGKCHLTNKVLIGGVVIVCTIICFCSSFTDSLCYNGKVYYAIASRKGLLVFNYDNRQEEEPNIEKEATDIKLQPKDFVHAFLSAVVFLVFA